MDEQTYIITFDTASAADANRYAEELRQALLDASPDVKVDLRLMILACKGNRSPMKNRQCHPARCVHHGSSYWLIQKCKIEHYKSWLRHTNSDDTRGRAADSSRAPVK